MLVCYTLIGMVPAIYSIRPDESHILCSVSKACLRTHNAKRKTGETQGRGAMIHVLIVCSWGMSTSLLVESMLTAAQESKYELTVEALSAGEYAAKVESCDIVLIAPQIRHLRKSIEQLARSVEKPVAMIEPFHYATMNGQAVVEQVQHLLATSRKG